MPKISELATDAAIDPSDLLPFTDVSASRTEATTADNLAASTAFSARYAPLGGLYLPGTSGVYVSLSDADALDAAGDLEIVLWVALDDWTPAATSALFGKYTSSGDQRSWYVGVNTSGTLQFTRSTAGTSGTVQNYVSTVSTGLANGASKWVKVTFDVNDGAGSSVVHFYLSDDGQTWTELGTAPSVASTVATHIGTGVVEIGTIGAGTIFPTAGVFRYASVASSIGGAPFAACNLTAPTGSRQRDTYGNTWTINGSTWAWVVADPFV